jgi:hypothetical protein
MPARPASRRTWYSILQRDARCRKAGRNSTQHDGYVINVVIRKLTNGHPDFIQVVSKSDGKDYPQYASFPLVEFQINGTKTPLTYSETVLDEHAVNVVGKYGDRVVNKGVRRVAPDGKTMRIDVTAIDQNGKETPFFLVFNKVR